VPRVFISYRRRESGGSAGRVRDRLIKVFGSRNVFEDVDKIHYGDDFQRAIDKAIRESTVLIAIIGQDWASHTGTPESGQKAPDYVYAEIETALRNGVPVVPVLVDEAAMPAEDTLPPSLSSISRLNYTEIKLTRFDADVSDLIRSIDDRSAVRRFAAAIPPWVVPMLVLGCIVGLLAYRASRPQPVVTPAQSQTTTPLGPPLTKAVESEILDRVVINPPIVRPGELVTISLVTNSSQVQASAVFDHGNGQKQKVSATYDRNRGGIIIEYLVPDSAKPGPVAVSVWVQELKGRKEERQSLTFEVRSKERVSDASGTSPLTLDALGFRVIKGGRFQMGSATGQRDERPVHRVTVNEFLLMDHELTFHELQRLAAQQPGLLTRDVRETLPNPDSIWVDKPITWDVLPVSVTFAEASRITQTLSARLGRKFRLPTEAEWEFAARGGLDGKKYPWGSPDDMFNGETVAALVERTKGRCAGFEGMPVHGVKMLTPPNAYGLYDLAGNVWEWTDSVYKPYPYAPAAAADLAKYPYRVIRGGGLAQESCRLEVSFRGIGDVASLDSTYGIRLATDAASGP
jgi:sulfatase modifying factor 1